MIEGSDYQTTGVCFTKGYCPKCYALLRQYHFDGDLCEAHELTQTLKKEIKQNV